MRSIKFKANNEKECLFGIANRSGQKVHEIKETRSVKGE